MIKYFRVDKMKQIRAGGGPRLGQQEFLQLDPGDLSKKTFGMFAGEKKRLTLLFENELIGVAIDRFGQDVPLMRQEDDHFRIIVEVNISGQFYGWLAGIGKGVQIVEPQEERHRYKQYLQDIANVI